MRGATFLGRGAVRGHLFDLGEYPGAVVVAARGSRVRGELYRWDLPETALRALDRYEGCGADVPGPHLFERELTEVMLDGGGRSTAWVYWYCGSLVGARPIPCGEYLGRRLA